MAFDLTIWKEKAAVNLRGWKERLVPAAMNSAYVAVCAGVLWPVVVEARAGDAFGAAMAVMSLTAGLGTNLLSDQIRKWKDEANGERDVAQWLAERAGQNAQLRAELDAALEKLEALALARDTLHEADRQWFADVLQGELTRLGSWPRFEATVHGQGNLVVQGQGHTIDYTFVEKQEIHQHALDPQAQAAQAEAAARRRYLERFSQWCNVLPLAALGGEEGAADDLTLDSVYIGLHTTTRIPLTEAEKEERQKKRQFIESGEPQDRDTRPLPALDAAAQAPRLVLLGDPGSGKSTFARYWLSLGARAELKAGEPPPGWIAGLLPLFLTLRDLAPRLRPLDVQEPLTQAHRAALLQAVQAQLEADLKESLRVPEFSAGLNKALEDGSAVLVLDGLDEVPEDLRQYVRLAVSALLNECHVRRVLVTCRVRSYTGAALLPGFQAHTLAPFTPDHIRDFSHRWYAAQPARFDTGQVQARAADLEQAALSDDLRPLAANPMMLTSMAILHQREIGLPRERVKLYQQLVDVLLRRWQKGKTPALAAFLQDELRLRAVLERLAFEAHAAGKGQRDSADLARGVALTLLEQKEYLGSAALAAEFLDYVDQRAGLLVGRGGEPGHPAAYSFPHRTLQEYLAGCYLAGQRRPYVAYFERAAEGDYWALAAQLGAEDLLYNRRHPHDVLDLAYQLLTDHPDTARKRRAVGWGGNLAALLGRDAVEADDAPNGGAAYLQRLRPRLVDLLASDLNAPERAEAGRALAVLGDPRAEVITVGAMEFCYVPAGPFQMGSDKQVDAEAYEAEQPAHTLDLPAFWMGRHPVTNAQYAEFVAAGGYGVSRYWPEAEAAGYWKDGRFKGRGDREPRVEPENYGAPFNLHNHPVVGVNWYEALAFTRWLTERFQIALPKGYAIALPSEAEWEKAARGAEGNKYPWGRDEPTGEHARFGALRGGGTSPVDAFPRGASPYGMLGMAGNVFEWCEDVYDDGFYLHGPERNPRNTIQPGSAPCVVRGGSWAYDARALRTYARTSFPPTYRLENVGFRVAL